MVQYYGNRTADTFAFSLKAEATISMKQAFCTLNFDL